MFKIKYPEYVGAKTCRAKNDIRYYFNALYIDSEGLVVATDGHRMFVGPCEIVGDNPFSEFGLIVDIKGKEPSKFNYVSLNTDELSAKFYDEKDQHIATLPIQIIDGRYPQWRRATNYKEGKVSEIGFNFSYLADASKIGKAYGMKNNAYKMKFQDSINGVHFQFTEKAYMVLMPARIK